MSNEVLNLLGYGGGGLPGGERWFESKESQALDVRKFFFDDEEDEELFIKSLKESDRLEPKIEKYKLLTLSQKICY